MTTKKSTVLALTLALVATACSQAQEPTAGSPRKDAPRPPVIASLEKQGLEVLGEFKAPGGLKGYAGVAGQRPLAVYLTPDGRHALVGTLIGENGEDVGAAAVQRLVAEPMSRRIWSQLEKSHWIADGKADAPRIVYAFSDPNCPYCNRFWHAARPWVEAGKVQLRHVLVGVIREDSANKAAAILTAASPSAALARNEQQYAQGGIRALPAVGKDVRAQLDANERLMLELGFQGTPGIVFRDEANLVQRRSGLPAQADLPVVLGSR